MSSPEEPDSNPVFWFFPDIVLPEGAAQLDEEAIRQSREQLTEAVSFQRANLSPSERLRFVNEVLPQYIAAANEEIARQGGSFEQEVDYLAVEGFARFPRDEDEGGKDS